MDSLTLDIIFEVENMECNKILTGKVYLIIKSNQLLSNAAHFLSLQGIFKNFTFDLYFKMYLNTEALCMKFTYH